jgi:hypothetical protein
MTAKVLWDVVRAAAAAAGIDKLAPHDLRRTCARLCHLAGGELDQIQFLLGMCRFRRPNDTSGVSRSSDAPSTTAWASSRIPHDPSCAQGGSWIRPGRPARRNPQNVRLLRGPVRFLCGSPLNPKNLAAIAGSSIPSSGCARDADCCNVSSRSTSRREASGNQCAYTRSVIDASRWPTAALSLRHSAFSSVIAFDVLMVSVTFYWHV